MTDPAAPNGGARGGRPANRDECADDGDVGLLVKSEDAPVLNWIGGRVEIADADDAAMEKRLWCAGDDVDDEGEWWCWIGADWRKSAGDCKSDNCVDAVGDLTLAPLAFFGIAGPAAPASTASRNEG
jgi:hypothetical protein